VASSVALARSLAAPVEPWPASTSSAVPDKEVAEPRRRVAVTMWPQSETVTDDSQGVRLATVHELAHYRGKDYDCARVRRN
jgi:hypothetical protein